MKRKLQLTLLFTFVFGLFTLNAQSPNLMSYQAVIRDASGNLIKDRQVDMKITILQGAADGSVVFSEEHLAATNENGLVSMVIGSGVPAYSETNLKSTSPDDDYAIILSGDFSAIDWSAGPYFIKVETDPTGGTNYTITGTSQLLSVPYAKYAESSGNIKFTDGDSSNDAVYTGGNVGVGTAAPLGKFDVRTVGWSYPFVISHNTLGHTDIIQAGDGLLFKNSYATDSRIAYGFRNSEDEHLMDVISNGNVGIGTTEPKSKLTVSGTIESSSGGIKFPDGTVQVTKAVSSVKYNIGDFAQGGVVFWVDETGQHGLVCDKADLPTVQLRWAPGTNLNTMAYGDGPFAGEMNTAIIISIQGYGNGTTYAALECSKLKVTENGKTYGDWYLPSIGELKIIESNLSIINSTASANGGHNLYGGYYYSSTEYDSQYVWCIVFTDGTIVTHNKYIGVAVRAIRQF